MRHTEALRSFLPESNATESSVVEEKKRPSKSPLRMRTLAPDSFRLSNMCLADQRGNDESEDRDEDALIRGQSRYKIHLAARTESHSTPPLQVGITLTPRTSFHLLSAYQIYTGDDTWWDAVFGMTWETGPDSRVFAAAKHDFGGDKGNTWTVNVGATWNF